MADAPLSAEHFYDELATYFDVLTDWSARLAYEGPFLRRLFEEHRVEKVLDVACGTGGHVIEFARWGLRAVGADLSSAMIARARANAAAAGVTVLFIQVGFAELADHFPEPFDAVLCLGNSLPHLLDDKELLVAFRSFGQCLRPGGLLLLHNLNYDKRWREQPRFFAPNGGQVDGQEVLIWRFADYHEDEGLITFHTALFRKEAEAGWQVQVNSTPQRPLFQSDLLSWLWQAGFVEHLCYGNLTGEPFDAATSPDLVIVTRRSGRIEGQ
ncbi:MAG: class I SAM-dependent methyltransferase [Anaerolineae bacterium]